MSNEIGTALGQASPEAEQLVRSANDDQVELTVLMPCLDEAETIRVCIEKALGYLEQSGVVGEVLVADNGSTDGSMDIAAAAGARVIAVDKKGYGAALIGGIAAARGRYVIMGDADDSYDFSALAPFVEELRGGADLVIGNRFRGGIAPGAMPFLHRYLGNPVLSFLGRLFYRIPIGDFHCGLRGFSRDAIRALGLSAPGMEFASEMIVKASLKRLTLLEVPATLSRDGRARPPHLSTWGDGWRHLRFLLLHSPRWLFYYPGLVMIAAGLLLSLLLLGGDLPVAPGVEIGIHTMITASFAVVIGVQLVSFAVLARRHAASTGVIPAEGLHDLLQGITLERILLVATVLFIGGLSGFGVAVGYWVSIGLGAIEREWVEKVVVLSLTVLTIAVQLAFTGFLGSALLIDRK